MNLIKLSKEPIRRILQETPRGIYKETTEGISDATLKEIDLLWKS